MPSWQSPSPKSSRRWFNYVLVHGDGSDPHGVTAFPAANTTTALFDAFGLYGCPGLTLPSSSGAIFTGKGPGQAGTNIIARLLGRLKDPGVQLPPVMPAYHWSGAAATLLHPRLQPMQRRNGQIDIPIWLYAPFGQSGAPHTDNQTVTINLDSLTAKQFQWWDDYAGTSGSSSVTPGQTTFTLSGWCSAIRFFFG